jgi:hypothetical protein
VVWACNLSQRQIDRVRARDKADKKAYIEAINQQKDQRARQTFVVAKLWQPLMRWWKSE